MSDPRAKIDPKVKSAPAQRKPVADGVLRARPVTGKIDYVALIRHTIARFPKILAALAK